MRLLLKTKDVIKGRNAGQAAIELALFGAVAFMIIAAMLNYAQTIAMQQEVGMYAFRRTLQLSKNRGRTGASRQVDLTVFKEVYPVSLFDSNIDRQKVSSSASIDWEYDSETLDREERDSYPAHYWQFGRRMIARNELIELPTMHVRVRNDKEKESRSFFKNMYRYLITGGNSGMPDYSDVWQAAPVELTLTDNLKTTVAQDSTQEQSGSITSRQNVVAREDNRMVMQMQPNDKIINWSYSYVRGGYQNKIVQIYSKPGDVTINEQEDITKERVWTTPLR